MKVQASSPKQPGEILTVTMPLRPEETVACRRLQSTGVATVVVGSVASGALVSSVAPTRWPPPPLAVRDWRT